MKTVPFNAEQAKAGRPVVASGRCPVSVLAVDGTVAWVRLLGTCCRQAFYTHELFHPADPAPGHNPAGLDEWQVETRDGWRLLEREELDDQRDSTGEIEAWTLSETWSAFGCFDGYEETTYRTKRPPGHFLPRPKTRPIRQEELPEAIVVKNTDDYVWVTYSRNMTQNQIGDLANRGSLWSRSLDGPWRPFTVEDGQ